MDIGTADALQVGYSSTDGDVSGWNKGILRPA
jgi:hypothetical protein